MTSHLTVRLVWHDRGWDGCICDKPAANVFCTGQFSLAGEVIRQRKNEPSETQTSGKFCGDLDDLPPCTWTINAFSEKSNKHVHIHPFLNNASPKSEPVQPYSAGTWSYDKMYDRSAGGIYPLRQREAQIKEYFDKFEPGKSLVFFYLNFDNPLNSENKRYILVGISRLRDLGNYLSFEGLTEQQLKRYGSLVWSRFVSHGYPEEGVRIPYQEYLKQGKDVQQILYEISGDFTRQFKYVSRDLSDDVATELVERMITVVKRLKLDNVVKEDWDKKLSWLNQILGEVWKNRGLFPGLGGILEYLGFEHGTTFVKKLVNEVDSADGLGDYVFKLLDGHDEIDEQYNEQLRQARKKWVVLSSGKKSLLTTIARFELNEDQIGKIVGEKKKLTGISSNLKQLRENPYLLCEEYVGEDEDDRIGFYRIDNGFFPDKSLGIVEEIKPNDRRRLRALIIERLRSEKSTGNCFLEAEDVFEYVEHKRIDWRACNIDLDTINADRTFFEERLLFVERNDRNYVYLKSIAEDEQLIEKRVRRLLQRAAYPASALNWNQKLTSNHEHIAESVYASVLNEQSQAVEKSYRHALSVITGAAGTGKTQVVYALIKGIKEREGRQTFLLLAPTGKAATRLSERTRIQTKTIHLALIEHDWINESNYKFKPDGKPLVAQNIIVDEASMIDLELMGQLFRAIDWNRVKRFVLVGDPNQLPPIGFGRPFLDIINFLVPQSELKKNIASLTINCRQLEKNSMVLRLAEVFTGRMRSKNYEEILSTIDQIAKAEQRNGIIGEDLEVHFWKDEHDVEEAVMKKLKALLKDECALSGQPTYEHFNKLSGIPYTKERGLDYFQILTPYRGYYYGTAALNVLIQNEFRGGLMARHQVKGFTLFDKVIQVHNTTIYRKDKDPVRLFNGQLGYVKTVWNNGDGVYVKFLDIPDDIPFTESGRHSIVENLELGYAITIHKAQGSDFQIVFLVIPKENTRLLSRELLYTALTRSKKKTVIFLQDDIEPLVQTMSPSKSAISERNTSIFVFRFTSSRYYENDLIHQTTNGDRVRSKSEVIIANELKNHGISYEYEKLLWSKKGDTFKRPDFTVFYEGEEYYWEHLGRMDDPAYVETWEAKRKWYEQNEFTDRLILSEEDSRGLDSRKIVETIETRFR